MNSDDRMNRDDSFEREVRTTLEGMAREPAPERLAAAVAAIPSHEPAPQETLVRIRPSGRGVASGFAAIAAVVALAVAGILLRPEAGPGPGASSATVPPTVGPSVPSAVAPATTTPSTAPASQATPTPAVVAGDPVPAGFRPMSVTFASAVEGWVLGSAACATGRCPVIAHTLDAGKTWARIPAPNTKIAAQPLGANIDMIDAGIAGLRFADAKDGWAFGPELWSTHDGGATWKRLDVLPSGRVVALETSRGTTHAVLYDGAQNFRIASAPFAGDAWSLSSVKIGVGGGPVPEIQLVLSGDAGWVLENDRVVTAGARLVGGTWRTWQPACADSVGPAFIGAYSASDITAACDVGAWSSPQGDHLFVSLDGGLTFTETGPRNPIIATASGLATPDRSTIVIAGSDTHGAVLAGSFDGGRTWTKVLNAGAVTLNDLGFTTTQQGVVISTASTGTSHLLMTHDGGKTWSTVTF
jgi:photosystem II stability/assembly factor-like uncharacterized protein